MLEYCDSGDLRKILKNPIKEKYTKYYFCQLVNGLKYLDKHNILHRDIKPRNILLSNNRKILKIADFGFAKKEFNNISLHDTICGSPLYMAPEILTNKPYCKKIDLWSIGLILYEMLYGHHPFENCKDLDDLKSNVYRIIHIPPKNTINTFISKECLSLLRQLLQNTASQRITWKELFNHPWINNNDNLNFTNNYSYNTPPTYSSLLTSTINIIDEYHNNNNNNNYITDSIDDEELIFNIDMNEPKKIKLHNIIENSSVLNASDKKYMML